MNGDIRPPQLPHQQPKSQSGIVRETPAEPDQSGPSTETGHDQLPAKVQKTKRSFKKQLIASGLLLVFAAIGAVGWYQWAIGPKQSSTLNTTKFVVEEGMTVDEIAKKLESAGLIRSHFAFSIYTRLNNARSSLQAGEFQINPSKPVAEIVEVLKEAKAEDLVITFYPGATLRDPRSIDDAKRTDVYTMLMRAGFDDSAIKNAFTKSYDHPLFAGKPAGTSLEGYIYGETYRFGPDVSVEQILKHTFDVYYDEVKSSGIIETAKQKNLTLYQAITLASIVQREVPDLEHQKIVAQVFYKRLAEGMPLGSDPTFVYAADQANVPRAVDLDSPYNTRLHNGLPPGPISAPGKTALEAVAKPTNTDYLYFVSGDDGKTYFAKTNEEHEANVARYCHKLCSEM